MQPPSVDFLSLFRTLLEHEVEFIVVGGVAAVLQGAPIATFDLDVVHSRTANNIKNVLSALKELNAMYRGREKQRLRATSEHRASAGHQLLMTRFGALDLLGTIGTDLDYGDLLPHSIDVEIEGMHLRVLDLGQIIRVKEQLGQPKDKAVLPILRQTLRERNKARQ